MTKRNNAHFQSMMMAYCGMTAALSAALLVTGTLIPVMTYAAPLMCGLLLLPVLMEFGKKAAWLTWGASALIVVMLGTDKEAAFFYLFLGYYPILKWEIEKLRSKPLKLLIKAGIFSAALALIYWILMVLLHMEAVAAEFAEMGRVLTIAFFICMVMLLLFYDRLLFPMCIVYTNRIKPHLRFLHHR